MNREKRFEVNEMVGFDAIMYRAGSDESHFYADLIDFSRTGMKLNVPFCARFNEILVLKLDFAEEEFSYEGKCRVRHMRSLDDNQWQVGCSIDPPLSLPMIERLAKTTNQERREYSRIEVDGEGLLRRQGSAECSDAKITNLSNGGFCVKLDTQLEIGEKIDFVTIGQDGADRNVAAKVKWKVDCESGFEFGCSFLDSDSYLVLLECFDVTMEVEPVESESLPWKMAAAAVIALVLPSLSYFLLGNGAGNPRVAPVDRAVVVNAGGPQAKPSAVTKSDSEVVTIDSQLADPSSITTNKKNTDGSAQESEIPNAAVIVDASARKTKRQSVQSTLPKRKTQEPSQQEIVATSQPKLEQPIALIGPRRVTSRRQVAYEKSIVFPGVDAKEGDVNFVVNQSTSSESAISDRTVAVDSQSIGKNVEMPVHVLWEPISKRQK